MDPRYGTPRSVDAVDPTASYDTWPTLPSTREGRVSRCFCGRWRLSWSAVSVVEIALMLLTVVFYFFFSEKTLKHMLSAGKDDKITLLAEWVLRMVGSMVCVQITLLIAGIGWGDTITRKIIYWGMLTGDILLVAIQAAFVHSMSQWQAVNISIVTLASSFGLFRVITLIFNPGWWLWVPEPNF